MVTSTKFNVKERLPDQNIAYFNYFGRHYYRFPNTIPFRQATYGFECLKVRFGWQIYH